MIDLFGSLRSVIKRHVIITDNAVFRLHYLFTTIVLVAFSVMLTARQYFGNPIDCFMPKENVVPYINVYCWISSTFTMPGAHGKLKGSEVGHQGIDNSEDPDNGDPKYYAYYQWVAFFLFFQAMLFYIPRWLWKSWEGGLLNTIVLGMHVGVISEEDREKKKKVLVDYLTKNLRRHNGFAIKYFVCEFLCLVNVIGQMYLMDKFLGGEFFTYGSRVLEYSEMEQNQRGDPMIFVFPRVTKCLFHMAGPSGDIMKHDALCILPQNIVNEKIFIFIWFWFIILAVLTALVVLYRVLLIAMPRYRYTLLRARARHASPDYLRAILNRANLGDWFLYYLLAKNLDPVVFREMAADLAGKIETADSNINSS